MKIIKNHLVLVPILLPFIIMLCIGGIYDIQCNGIFSINDLVIITIVFGLLLGYPIVLTMFNLLFLFIKTKNIKIIKAVNINEIITIVLGCIYSFMFSMISEVRFMSDFDVQLKNGEIHTPIYTKSFMTIFTFILIGIIGYSILKLVELKKMPPILLVLSFSFLYIGIVVAACFIIQIFNLKETILFAIFPFNAILLALRLIKKTVIEWNENAEYIKEKNINRYKSNILNKINSFIVKSNKLPLIAFIFLIPLLGILICILSLLGQQPDSFIKAWTETSEWNLSNCVSPQNITVDEHYLCTVAAGGHKKVVKPLRKGIRHGHTVVVNRQLLVANAFEEIIQEKTPKFHRVVRSFYDKYGFPIAKLIKSKYTADIVYFIMKPLEWVFLFVIYLCDVNPENRIAVQYTGKSINELKRAFR